MRRVRIEIGYARYAVYVDTDDKKQIDKIVLKFKRHFAWWKFWNRFIVLPKGAVEVVRI